MATKKKIPEMLPVRKWLSFSEVCKYTGYSANTFYKVVELDGIFESLIIKRKVT